MAKQEEAPKGKSRGKPRRKSRGTLLWTLLGLVILTAGVLSALYYTNRQRIQSDAHLRVIKDFVARVDHTVRQETAKTEGPSQPATQATGMAPAAPAKPMPATSTAEAGGVRTYRVKAGENLWHIATTSGLVDNPWQWRTILVQNRKQIDWAFINAGQQDWKVMIDKGAKLTVRPDGQPTIHPSTGRKYTVQLASMNARQVKRAQYVVRRLMGDGFYAYLYRVERNGETWYRIRTGLYDSEARAKAMGAEIRQHYAKAGLFPDKPWVLQPSRDEREGKHLVFGAELVGPWVVQLRNRDTHAEAVKDLHAVRDVGDFGYIWQTQNPITKRFEYHVRIGFFGDRDGAQRVIDTHHGDEWEQAEPVKVEKFEETLPGQPMYLGGLRS